MFDSEKAFGELVISLRMKCFVSQKVKPDLPAHSDIKIEVGDTDIRRRKFKSGYSLLLFSFLDK